MSADAGRGEEVPDWHDLDWFGGSEARQDRVTRAPAGPLVGDRAQLAVVGLATVVVVVRAVPAVGRVVAAVVVVGWVVGAEDGAEEDGAAVWSALGRRSR